MKAFRFLKNVKYIESLEIFEKRIMNVIYFD